jgi:hypothetical protein
MFGGTVNAMCSLFGINSGLEARTESKQPDPSETLPTITRLREIAALAMDRSRTSHPPETSLKQKSEFN